MGEIFKPKPGAPNPIPPQGGTGLVRPGASRPASDKVYAKRKTREVIDAIQTARAYYANWMTGSIGCSCASITPCKEEAAKCNCFEHVAELTIANLKKWLEYMGL